MKRPLIALLLAACLLCGGCHRGKIGEAQAAVVTEIRVSTPGRQEQVYRSPEKLRLILSHLRNLGQEFTPKPAVPDLPPRTVLLTRSDGTRRRYRFIADLYIQRDDAPWKQTDGKRIAALNVLLDTLPGD